MDFIEAKHVAAREIALALGVPPMLLAIPGDNTYSNYQEATRPARGRSVHLRPQPGRRSSRTGQTLFRQVPNC